MRAFRLNYPIDRPIVVESANKRIKSSPAMTRDKQSKKSRAEAQTLSRAPKHASYGPTLVLALGLANPHIRLSLLNGLNSEIITKKMNAEARIFRPVNYFLVISFNNNRLPRNSWSVRLYVADWIDTFPSAWDEESIFWRLPSGFTFSGERRPHAPVRTDAHR